MKYNIHTINLKQLKFKTTMQKITLIKTGILLFFFITTISLLLFYFNMKMEYIAAIMLFGLAVGIVAMGFNGFYIPGKWVHKNRFMLYGLLFGLALFVFNIINHISEGDMMNGMKLGLNLFISICLGGVFGGIYLKWKHRVFKRQTPLNFQSDEMEIIEDVATIFNEDVRGKGRIVLTSERLSFIFSDIPQRNFDIYFSTIKSNPELMYRFGIPNGIYISEQETRILVKFPKFWKQEIEKKIKDNNI